MLDNTLYLGGDGYIGSYLKNRPVSILNNVRFTTRRDSRSELFFDILRIDQEMVSRCSKYDTIIFGIANSSPEFCFANYEQAYKINVESTAEAINSFLNAGVKVLFLSSDVADLECGAPVGSYAYMKSLIEREFMHNARFKVVRLSYVFSNNDKFTSYLHYCVNNNIIAEIYDPFYRNIIYLDDVADALMAIVGSWELYPKTFYNLYGAKSISRVQMAEIFKGYFPELDFSISPPPVSFSAHRPLYICPKFTDVEDLICRKPKEYSSIFTEGS